MLTRPDLPSLVDRRRAVTPSRHPRKLFTCEENRHAEGGMIGAGRAPSQFAFLLYERIG